MKLYWSLGALLISGPAAAAGVAPGAAFTPAANASEQQRPTAPAVLPLRERARLEDRWLAERLDLIVPALMREQNIDMWVLVAREYVEDPVVATMLDAESMHARRRTILLFYDPGEGKPLERLTVSRYGLANLFSRPGIPNRSRTSGGSWESSSVSAIRNGLR